MTKGCSSEKEPYREPPSNLFINPISPNSNKSPQPTSSNEDGSPDSYISYSSAAYSSVGEGDNGIPSNTLNEITRAKSIRPNSMHVLANESVAGHGLLSEVLKMQSLLEEYQHALTVLEVEKADKQQEIHKLDKLLKGKGETEERYKDEIWSLEIAKQELLQKIHDMSQHLTRSNSEQTRLVREEIKLTQELEQIKAARHTWQTEIQKLKEQHEVEVKGYKKLLHDLRVEKDNATKQLQEFTAQKQNETTQQQTTLRHVEEPTTEQHVTETNHQKENIKRRLILEQKPIQRSYSLQYDTKVNTLEASLEQAHSIIQSMQATIDKERQERIEVDKLLTEAQETIEALHNQPNDDSPGRSTSVSSFDSKEHQWKIIGERSSIQSPFPQGGTITLCDELSRVGSTITFSTEQLGTNNIEETKAVKGGRSVPKINDLHNNLQLEYTKDDEKETAPNDKETIDKDTQTTTYQEKPKVVKLTSFNLPPVCNHDIEQESVNETVPLEQIFSNHEYYGSLIKEPESYIYNSQRESSEEKKKQHFSPIKLNFSDTFHVNTKFPEQQETSPNECGESSIKAMTRAMIGDWMWKYTKSVVRLENKHRRFFWIHPYSQTLYWNAKEPGTKASQSGTKSVLIESFSILDNASEKNKPPCILVQTLSKGMQIQCLDFDAHYAWIKTLHYLLNTNNITQNLLPTKVIPENGKVILDRKKFSSLRKSNNFSKILKQTENNEEPIFNNSTLINLSFHDDNFQQQTLLDFAAIK